MTHPDDLARALLFLRSRQLRDFGPPSAEWATMRDELTYRLDTTYAVMGQLLYLALRSRGAIDMPVIEKTFWELDFSYKTIPCQLCHAKSGVKLSLWFGEDVPAAHPPDVLAKEIETRLGSAAKDLQTKVVEPGIARQKADNNVRIINQHDRYGGFVSYFRAKLDQTLHQIEQPPELSQSARAQEAGGDLEADLMEMAGHMWSERDRRHEVAYLATALLAGYFSLVQHRFVLLTGFSPAAIGNDFSVERLVRRRGWWEQFELATSGRQEPRDQTALSDLHYLAKEYRNTLLHGGGGRLADGLFVEWAPGYHAIETERGVFTDQFMLWQPALTVDEARGITAKMDRIEAWFRSLPYFAWVEAGLPVSFARSAVELALEHLRNETVADYIEREEARFDMGINGEL
ncbi:hypothetical protein [Nocardia cyriacigeorgica]|uniref:hypothetical protein n=1 Tax=Nocardia cyriacigeorgica TaxID=135487 RepID=UPI002456D3CD|nr:hypothetical protein [Nocardia cyriacigeorgica]